jgi:hypothetical protein
MILKPRQQTAKHMNPPTTDNKTISKIEGPAFELLLLSLVGDLVGAPTGACVGVKVGRLVLALVTMPLTEVT